MIDIYIDICLYVFQVLIDYTSTDTSTAIEISKLEEQSNQEVKKQHLRRLTQLLDVNGLVMTAVHSDGDCFFASTLHMVKSVKPSVDNIISSRTGM